MSRSRCTALFWFHCLVFGTVMRLVCRPAASVRSDPAERLWSGEETKPTGERTTGQGWPLTGWKHELEAGTKRQIQTEDRRSLHRRQEPNKSGPFTLRLVYYYRRPTGQTWVSFPSQITIIHFSNTVKFINYEMSSIQICMIPQLWFIMCVKIDFHIINTEYSNGLFRWSVLEMQQWYHDHLGLKVGVGQQ